MGIGDDCAILNIPAGCQLSVSVDNMLEGRHFPKDIDPAALAWRALAAAASDLAAAGASPLGFTLSLALPDVSEAWLSDFSAGLFKAASAFNMPLVGGDTTKGPLNIGVQVLGTVQAGRALLRSGAKVDDDIWLSGALGGAHGALAFLPEAQPDNLPKLSGSEMPEAFFQAYYYPMPCLRLGQQLIGVANSAVDISDGLLADLTHILVASSCGASLDLQAIPLCSSLVDYFESSVALDCALNGGDDYQLCFTAGVQHRQYLDSLGCVCIGKINCDKGIFDIVSGEKLLPDGFSHF